MEQIQVVKDFCGTLLLWTQLFESMFSIWLYRKSYETNTFIESKDVFLKEKVGGGGGFFGVY